MKVTLNWLKQYVDFHWSAEELADRLTMLGLEVEAMEKVSGEFEGIVVAQVVTHEPHPNADKLSVCKVNNGAGERQIVCGAHNFKAGDKVALILPGHALPASPGEKPLAIKVGKIRGVESHGMMCSPKELGLAEEADGILILPPDARLGQPFAEHLGRSAGDVVFDLEITPNRPDWNSVIGIAREIAAVTGNPLKIPAQQEAAASESPGAGDLASVRLDDPDLCPRYTARVIRGIKVGPSPDWLRSMLEKVGQRSINNVVDVTNFVMFETGQPLHAFDYHLLAKDGDGKAAIVVRRAAPGEQFVTLDEQEHKLTEEHLLIADPQKAVALAGIMGGRNSEIHQQTVDVLLESAYFKPANIRRTSKALGLRTDASYRFERGADIGMADWASRRAAELIVQTAGGQLAGGVVDAYPHPAKPRTINLRPEKVSQLLGVEIPRETCAALLLSLGLTTGRRVPQPVDTPPGQPTAPLSFTIPTFRVDLKREVDLIEEVARLYGVEKIPATPPRGALGAHPFDAEHDQIAEARRLLTGLGLSETQGQTLISHADCHGLAPEKLVRLANPLSADMDTLRPSLLPGLVHALHHNISHKNADLMLFEVGRIFLNSGGQTLEERRVAVALTGRRQLPFWSGTEREAKTDAADLKGVLEEFLEQFGLRGIVFRKRPAEPGWFFESAQVQIGGKVDLGEMGLLSPALARQHDLRDPVWLAELRLDDLLGRRSLAKPFRPLPAYPAIRRDVAMLVAEPLTHEAVLAAVRNAKPQHLERVEVFDIFRGKNVPAGQKSMAYSFIYRHAERTLTDAEVNGTHEQLVAHLRQALSATIRE